MRVESKKRVIVGVSGATGSCLAAAVLRGLKEAGDWEIHLIVTDAAKRTIELEYEPGLKELESFSDVVCDPYDLANGVASGSFKAEGMIVVPCSMKTLAGIASGYSNNLLLRAADVTLKERRRLVLAPRESPISTIHCRNMLELSQMGCILVPPMLSYYNKPTTVQEMTDHVAYRILDAFGVPTDAMRRWETPKENA